MVGATWITVAMNGVAMAVMPFMVGALAAIVAGGRFRCALWRASIISETRAR